MEKEEALFLVSCGGEQVGSPRTREVVLREAQVLAQERFWQLWGAKIPKKLTPELLDHLDIQLYALVEEPLPLQAWLDEYDRMRSLEEAVEQLRYELQVEEEHLLEVSLKFSASTATEVDFKNAVRKVERAKERLSVAIEGTPRKGKKK